MWRNFVIIVVYNVKEKSIHLTIIQYVVFNVAKHALLYPGRWPFVI